MPVKKFKRRRSQNPMSRKYEFKHPIRRRHYSADAFTVRCVDNRFWKTFKRFIRFRGYEDIDPKSPAGGAKVFSSPSQRSVREHYLQEIALSRKLHHIKRVMLFTHHDCGAYGGIQRFGGDENKELAFHKNEHKKARRVVNARFPGLPVETYFIDRKGVIRTF